MKLPCLPCPGKLRMKNVRAQAGNLQGGKLSGLWDVRGNVLPSVELFEGARPEWDTWDTEAKCRRAGSPEAAVRTEGVHGSYFR